MINLPLNIDFTGKVVVVTGAGGVLCGDMARAYAQAGAKVAALDLNEAAVEKLAAELTAEGFICKGYNGEGTDTRANTLNTVKETWGGSGYLTIKEGAWQKILRYYEDLNK